jgi:AraC-like DNA-binding protein
MGASGSPSVSIHVVRGTFAEAIARGQEPAELCRRFGVSPEQLSDPDARVGAGVLRRIWDELPARVGASDFGLAVARRAEASGAFALVGYLARSAATVGDALRLAVRYQRLVQDAAVSTWTVANDVVEIATLARDPAYSLPRHAVEFGFAAALLLTRRATGRALAPLRIAFRHARPADDAEARALFRCPIAYGAPVDVVALSAADLALPLHSADPNLAALLEQHARSLEQRLPPGDSFISRVRRALADRLAGGEPDLDTLARALGSSRRTLQRRLRDEGTTHQRVLRELRRDLAVRYLDEGVGLQEIAFVLGFADQSAFTHAFKRWTGSAPSEFRRRAR